MERIDYRQLKTLSDVKAARETAGRAAGAAKE